MPLSAALELLFGVLCVAKVGGGEGDKQPYHRGNFILLGGISPSAAVWERDCPSSHPSHGQDCMPGLPMLFLREQLNLNLALLHVLHHGLPPWCSQLSQGFALAFGEGCWG